MKASDKAVVRSFIPETLLYGALAVTFCWVTATWLGKPLVTLFKKHRVEYGLAALGLMIFQGFVLERITHGICVLFRGKKKAPQ